MKYDITKIYLGVMTFFLIFVFGIGVIAFKNAHPKITVAQCPALVEKVDIGTMKDCERSETNDLLQPSGLWVSIEYRCWELKTPIDQFCKEKPEYCFH